MTKNTQAPAEVTATFRNWQTPKRGSANPENQTNVVWSWLIKSRAWPHIAHKAAGHSEQQTPGWCFDRFGQSKTELADGTIVYIGGEHEDHYDPNFFVYNDVVILRPDGSIKIYGYPVDVFPSTDFHTATLWHDAIYIIGGAGYANERDPTDTFVYRLRLSDFSIYRIETLGIAPCWLHDHSAELDPTRQKIICSGGSITHNPTGRNVENLTIWEFDLTTHAWSSVETKSFQRWLLIRKDESLNELWGIGLVVNASRSPRASQIAAKYREEFKARGHVVDAELYEARFTPPFEHTPIYATAPYGDNGPAPNFLVEGVMVRVMEDIDEITITVEGKLPPELQAALERFGLETYSTLEGVSYKSIHL